MPLARIDVAADTSAETVKIIGAVIYEAMTGVANVPANDLYQIVTRHAKEELIYPEEGYLGVTYTPQIVFIQVTWNAGRSIEVKKAFYKAIADGIHERAGIRKEDVFITLIDVQREDWSFGNGEMQYAPKP
ncbi:tautomerase family protein [Pseudomonas sp. NPDC088368]|uniref:tautomerase family protein n=1 Tax=Pseudomonas sp. NPDC088368 TaxID=3364453 RepID=UPI0037F39173